MLPIAVPRIKKHAVVGWLVVKGKLNERVSVMPLAIDHNGSLSEVNICFKPGDDAIAVIPAAPETYEVWADGEGMRFVIGYELPGASHPDWLEEAAKQRDCRQR